MAEQSLKISEDGEAGPRVSHNLIEKRYRSRLNGQFEDLLQTLPAEMRASSVDEQGDGQGSDKRIPKGEVLSLAQKYIRELEKKGDSLEEENKKLEVRKEELERNLVMMGGVPMP